MVVHDAYIPTLYRMEELRYKKEFSDAMKLVILQAVLRIVIFKQTKVG